MADRDKTDPNDKFIAPHDSIEFVGAPKGPKHTLTRDELLEAAERVARGEDITLVAEEMAVRKALEEIEGDE